MNFKSLALLTIFIFFSLFTPAQELQVKWGEDNEIPRKSYIKKLLGEDGNNFFLLRTQGESRNQPGEMWLEKYDSKTASRISSSRLSVPRINGENVTFEQLLMIEGKLLLFTSYYDRESATNSAFVQELNSEGNALTEPKLLNQVKAWQKRNTGRFEIVLSSDSSKILVCTNEPFEKYSNEKLSYKVFDKSFNSIWETQLELPYSDRELKISNHILDNSGNVHMLARITKKFEKPEKGQAAYYFTIISYLHKDDLVREYELSLKDKSISDIAFNISPAGDLVAAGFYSNSLRGQSPGTSTQYGFNSVVYQEQKSQVAGTFYIKINQQQQRVTARNVKEFDRNFLNEFMSQKSIERGRELYSFLIDHFMIREDGGAILVGEQYFSSMLCNYDPRTGIRNCNYHYYYNDIVVVNINADGSIGWTKKVPKSQHSINDNGFYSSYICLYDYEKVYLIFNDHHKNTGLQNTRQKTMNNANRAIVMLASIDKSGNLKRTPLFNAKDQKVIIRPKIFIQTGINTAFIYGQKRRTYKMGKINLAAVSAIPGHSQNQQ